HSNQIFIKSYLLEWYDETGTFLHHDPLQNGNSSKRHIDYLLTSKSGDYLIRQPDHDGANSTIKKYSAVTEEVRSYDINSYYHSSQPMIETEDGSIWLAGLDDILSRLDADTGHFISYDLETGKQIQTDTDKERLWSKDFATALFEDKNSILWVGSEKGFIKVKRQDKPNNDLQKTKYQNIAGDLSSLSYNHVSCFLDDPYQPDRFLWVCTKGGGLNRLDKKTGTFIHLTKKDGLPDDVVYGLLADEEGNLWGSTNKGLFCMSQNRETRKDNEPVYRFRNFSKADGLQENEFNTGAYTKMPDGKLAFGGINGYNVFDPKEILTEAYEPPTYITNILLNNKSVVPHDETGILKNTIETTREITLSHLDNILTLEFATLDFNAPDRNKHRYQLVGADDTWVEAGNQRSATFLNLPADDYTFRVQGSNSQGIWSDHIAELRIHVLPPWWKTSWAYLLYGIIATAVAGLAFQFSIKRAKLKQQLAFEKQESDRVRELDTLKTQLFTNLTHEFRTPLTIIIGMAQQVVENPKEHFNDGMNMIINNGQNLLGLVNKMLSLSKLESGKMTLSMVQGDVVLYLRTIVESFRSFAAKKEIQIHFLPEVDFVQMDFDKEKLQQIVSNLISNAFKFTPDGGHIYFVIKKERELLNIKVKDTGRGIPEAQLDKIFNRFYQTDNSSTRQFEGTGIGLALCKDLVTLMEGEISVQSPPMGLRQGSEFSVTLPIRQEAILDEKVETPVYINKLAPAIAAAENRISSTETKIKTKINSSNLSAGARQAGNASTEQPLILLVEDNPDVVAYIASCLSDYRLAVAENGKEGVEMATEMIPDLIVSDVMMPVMDGFELCKNIKSDDRTNHIPVIMLTARADMDSKIEGLELGANAYLPKPFEKQELLLSIKNLFALREKLRQHYQSLVGLPLSNEVKTVEAPVVEDPFVLKVRATIEDHLNDFNFTVEQLAKELHLSHSQLGRKLDALTGFSPNRFIRHIRLQKAKELLQNPELSITAVAYDCGFSDPSYFTRVFKKEVGKTPVEWR
ncbi:MAG: ATP-binding protein, partial [Saprospiraceae bacterium]